LSVPTPTLPGWEAGLAPRVTRARFPRVGSRMHSETCSGIQGSFMQPLTHRHTIRVRYGETDQMGTFYHARALDWFECTRSEFIRARLGLSYAEVEARGVFLPVIEAHLRLVGRARYDDLLTIDATLNRQGRAQLRFDMEVRHADSGLLVVTGHTVHAFVDAHGRPIRPPAWFLALLERTPEHPPPPDSSGTAR